MVSGQWSVVSDSVGSIRLPFCSDLCCKRFKRRESTAIITSMIGTTRKSIGRTEFTAHDSPMTTDHSPFPITKKYATYH
jgi:hypothetical protein